MTPSELAESVAGLSNSEIRKLNHALTLTEVAQLELGASTSLQDLASDIDALDAGDYALFKAALTTESGGTKRGTRRPC